MFDNSKRAFIAINDETEVCLIPKMANRILSQKQELLEEERTQAAEEKERIRQQKEEQKAALEAERAMGSST
jgi:hypothetical protein